MPPNFRRSKLVSEGADEYAEKVSDLLNVDARGDSSVSESRDESEVEEGAATTLDLMLGRLEWSELIVLI